MVLLSDVHASNARISSSLPPGLVAVFIGATNGIGEDTLKKFAKYVVKPRVYFVGRSQEAGDRILAECRELNPDGEFTFIRADVSLLAVVDEVSQRIKDKEKTINLLFLTVGSAKMGEKTSEGLPFPMVLGYYARTRFIVNLLPLLRSATGLRRVVTVAASGREGPVDTTDLPAANISFLKLRGHVTSVITLSLETLAKKAPEVAFIHNYPGSVKTGIFREVKGTLKFVTSLITSLVPDSWLYIPNDESAERHLFLATSAKYPPSSGPGDVSGVPLPDGLGVARGTTGEAGSGAYAINWDCESSGLAVKKLLVELREEGLVERIWEHTEEEFKRITGTVAV